MRHLALPSSVVWTRPAKVQIQILLVATFQQLAVSQMSSHGFDALAFNGESSILCNGSGLHAPTIFLTSRNDMANLFQDPVKETSTTYDNL